MQIRIGEAPAEYHNPSSKTLRLTIMGSLLNSSKWRLLITTLPLTILFGLAKLAIIVSATQAERPPSSARCNLYGTGL